MGQQGHKENFGNDIPGEEKPEGAGKSIAERAKEMGHIPFEEWNGPADQWRSAEEFVKVGENNLLVMRKELRETKEEIGMLIKSIEQREKAAAEAAFKNAKADFDRQVEELKKKELEAVESGDVEAFEDIQKKKESLKAPEPAVQKPKGNTAFDKWVDNNPWYKEDKELQEYADMYGSKFFEEHKDSSLDEVYAEVEKKVRALFPHKFENPKRKEPGAVEGGSGLAAGGGGKKTFADLPDSAKATYRRLAKRFKEENGREYTEKEYAKAYWDQEE